MAPGGVEPPPADSKSAALSTELRGLGAQYARVDLRGSLGLLLVAHVRDEDAHDGRVVLRAGAAHELVQSVLFRQRLAVRAVRDHRDVRTADADDPRGKGDLVGGEPVRVPAAVPVLVARANDARHAAERRGCAQDALADDGVLADEPPFALVERAGFVEDLVGNRELAEVVELSGALELLELVPAEAERGADVERERSDVGALRLELWLSER